MREHVADAVRMANAHLTVHERVAAWTLWPDTDFPRTPTAKVRRDVVREWALQARSDRPIRA
jgi:hypothetical protein